MTTYGTGDDYDGTIANDADRLGRIREEFGRPVQLLSVASSEMNMTLEHLLDVTGQTWGYQQVQREVRVIQDDLSTIAGKLGDVRLRLERMAEAIRKAGS